MRIALLGPPGSGKGTQAAIICQKLRLDYLASGDILRAEKSSRSPLGQKIREYIDSGALVPDQIMLDIIGHRVAALASGFVLDGFPRTLPQAQALTEMLARMNRPLDCVLQFVVDAQVIARRFAGRRLCPKCLSVYHVEANPPRTAGLCDKDNTPLIIRDDDKPEVVAKRITTYLDTIAPVIAYYRELGLLKTVNAVGPIELVTNQALRYLAAKPPAPTNTPSTSL